MYSPETSEKLQKCVDDINTLKKIDFVIFTGDNISNAKKEYLKGFLKEVKRLNPPVYFVIGDRDVSKEKGLNKDTYREEVFKNIGWMQSLQPNYVFKKRGLVFIVVDGAKEFVTAPNGYYKQNTVDWLDKKLNRYKDKKVVILQHFPLLSGETPANNTYKTELYYEMLKNHSNVLAIIAGHFKKNDEQVKDGITHIVAPAYYITGEYKIIDIPESYDAIYTQLRHVE